MLSGMRYFRTTFPTNSQGAGAYGANATILHWYGSHEAGALLSFFNLARVWEGGVMGIWSVVWVVPFVLALSLALSRRFILLLVSDAAHCACIFV